MMSKVIPRRTAFRTPAFGLISLARRRWAQSAVAPIDHPAVVQRIIEESGWSPRYVFMTMMSVGIAVLGLLLSSPAVVIGAMLISPLMNPILGLGFSLTLFDFPEMNDAARRAVELAAWEARRWNIGAIQVPGLKPADSPKEELGLAGRRARAVADLLAERKVAALPAPASAGPLLLAPMTSDTP